MYWADMRGVVLKNFPQAPLLRQNTDEYLKDVDEIYLTDAYHSLSIEGYQVSELLIERVRSGSWDPETNRKDKEYADALAARGYWRAFQAVKKSLIEIFNKTDPGTVVKNDLSIWYRELFAPSCTSRPYRHI